MAKRISASFITRSAVLLALVLLFQSLRIFFPALALIPIGPTNLSSVLIGSLVNMTLVVASMTVGFWGAAIVGLLATVVSFLQGFMPPVPAMIFVIAVGNAIIAFVYRITSTRLKNSARLVFSVLCSSLAKFLFLFVSVQYLVIPFFVADRPPVAAVLSVAFGVQQLITALIGSLTATLILPSIQAALRKKGE